MYNIQDITDLIFTMSVPLFKKIIFDKEQQILANKNTRILQIKEHNSLKGICIYTDSADTADLEKIRIIHEIFYNGDNKYIAVKFKNFIFKDPHWNYLECATLKVNIKIINFLLRFGFKIVTENNVLVNMRYKR